MSSGESKHFNFIVSTNSQQDLMGVALVLEPTHDFIEIELTHDSPKVFQLDFDGPRPIHTNISVSEDARPGIYKVLVGAQSSDVATGKYVTVTIE